MTVEEIEILVTAKVEEALKEIQKMAPAIKKAVKDAQEAFSNVDTKSLGKKINQAGLLVKKKIQDMRKSAENNNINLKINNKEAQKQISQIQKQIDSLNEKINARQMKLNIINPQIDKIVEDTRNSVVPDGISKNDKAMDNVINSSLSSNKEFSSLNNQAQKLYTEIEIYNKQLEEAKANMSELEQETAQTLTTQKRLGSFFNAFKQKIEQTKPSLTNLKNSFTKLPKITQNITNNIKGMGKGLKQGLGHILRYAGALLSLQTIYSALSGSANTWLSSQNAGAQQLSANIEYMKYSIGSVFAPIIEYVIGLVYQLMRAIQSLVYAFSGVNIFAKATASSMKSASKSAKEAGKSLSSVHSEINNVSENNGNSGEGTVSPSFDLSQMDTQMSPFAQKLYDFFKPLKESWDNYGNIVIEATQNAMNGLLTSISVMWQSIETIITNGTIYKILTNIFNSIGAIGQAWANAWTNDNNGTEIIQGLANIINDITQAILNLVSSTGFQDFLNGVLTAISGIVQFLEPLISGFSEMLGIITEIVLSAIGDLLTTVGNALQAIAQNETASTVLEAVGMAIGIVVGAIVLWNSAQLILNGLMTLFTILTSPITLIILGIVAAITAIILMIQNWGTISEWFGDLWVSITTTLQEVWNNIKDFFINLWQGICDIAITIWTAISEFFSSIWEGIKNVAMNVWNAITTTISNVINGIKNTISNVLNTIKTVWNNIWTGIGNTIKNVWNGIWSCIKGIINLILAGIESFVNGVIKGINILLKGISGLANAVGSVIGLNPISLQLNTISLPRLAKGGIIDSPTVAMMGEYVGAKSNPEIVTPQNIMEETFDRVLSSHEWNDNSNNRPIQLTIYVGKKKLGQILLEDLQDMKRRTGKDIEALVEG